MELDMNEEHPITLIDPDNSLGIVRRICIIEGVPQDDTVLEELEKMMREKMNEAGFTLHMHFRHRIRNMGVKWYDV